LEGFFFRRGCEDGADGEKSVLNFCQHRFMNGIYLLVADESDVRIELINRSVTLDAEMVFGNALPSEKRRGSCIAGFGIDFHRVGFGLMESLSMRPSRKRMTRWAYAAISSSWVTRITVFPF